VGEDPRSRGTLEERHGADDSIVSDRGRAVSSRR
jgi:hypothetical protein